MTIEIVSFPMKKWWFSIVNLKVVSLRTYWTYCVGCGLPSTAVKIVQTRAGLDEPADVVHFEPVWRCETSRCVYQILSVATVSSVFHHFQLAIIDNVHARNVAGAHLRALISRALGPLACFPGLMLARISADAVYHNDAANFVATLVLCFWNLAIRLTRRIFEYKRPKQK